MAVGCWLLQAGSLVARLEAMDSDVDLNAHLLYDIISGNDDSAFRLHPTSGILAVAEGRALSRRSSTVHRLVVRARDRGSPPLQAVADLTVAVNDSAAAALTGGAVAGGRRRGLEVTVVMAGGAAVGGVMVLGCLVIVAVVVFFLRRRSRRRHHADDELDKHYCSR